jgi:hypothetical protein
MIKASRIVYLAASSLFLIGVSIQVFLAGMVVVALQLGWSNHGISATHWLYHC